MYIYIYIYILYVYTFTENYFKKVRTNYGSWSVGSVFVGGGGGDGGGGGPHPRFTAPQKQRASCSGLSSGSEVDEPLVGHAGLDNNGTSDCDQAWPFARPVPHAYKKGTMWNSFLWIKGSYYILHTAYDSL